MSLEHGLRRRWNDGARSRKCSECGWTLEWREKQKCTVCYKWLCRPLRRAIEQGRDCYQLHYAKHYGPRPE